VAAGSGWIRAVSPGETMAEVADVGAGLGAGGGGGSVAVACAYAKLPRSRLLQANFAANFMPDLN
jgi:hypothetical protein